MIGSGCIVWIASGFGTFRTWRDVRLESVNRLKADMINAEKFQKWFELPKADLAALAAKAKGNDPPYISGMSGDRRTQNGRGRRRSGCSKIHLKYPLARTPKLLVWGEDDPFQ